MPTLVLLRHAKAETLAANDRSRGLTERGREECAELRAWLAEQGVTPDRVLVSSAVRTQQTWDLAGVGQGEVVVEDRLYQAGPDEVRELMAELPADVATLVVVGHNPTLEDLAWELDEGDHARDVTNKGLGTAGVRLFALRAWDAAYGELRAWR